MNIACNSQSKGYMGLYIKMSHEGLVQTFKATFSSYFGFEGIWRAILFYGLLYNNILQNWHKENEKTCIFSSPSPKLKLLSNFRGYKNWEWVISGHFLVFLYQHKINWFLAGTQSCENQTCYLLAWLRFWNIYFMLVRKLTFLTVSQDVNYFIIRINLHNSKK